MEQTAKGQTVLITGASSGIGLELAKVFAREGYNLVLVARSELRLVNTAIALQQQHGITAQPIAKDLSRPEAALELYDQVKAAGITVDILVNNAGFGAFGEFTETNWEEECKMIQVNVTLATHLSKLFAADMVRRGSGRILNVASTAGFQPGPFMAVYYATKAYLLSFSQALSSELHKTGVRASCLCPGPTQTEFHERAEISPSKIVKDNLLMDVETVARIAYKGLMRNKRVIIPGMKNKMLVQALRFLPRKMVTTIIRRVQESRSNNGNSVQKA